MCIAVVASQTIVMDVATFTIESREKARVAILVARQSASACQGSCSLSRELGEIQLGPRQVLAGLVLPQ